MHRDDARHIDAMARATNRRAQGARPKRAPRARRRINHDTLTALLVGAAAWVVVGAVGYAVWHRL